MPVLIKIHESDIIIGICTKQIEKLILSRNSNVLKAKPLALLMRIKPISKQAIPQPKRTMTINPQCSAKNPIFGVA